MINSSLLATPSVPKHSRQGMPRGRLLLDCTDSTRTIWFKVLLDNYGAVADFVARNIHWSQGKQVQEMTYSRTVERVRSFRMNVVAVLVFPEIGPATSREGIEQRLAVPVFGESSLRATQSLGSREAARSRVNG